MEVRRVRGSRVRRCEAVHIGKRPQFPARRSQGASATSRFERPILSCCESCALESGGREVCVPCVAQSTEHQFVVYTCVQSILDGTLCTGHECVSHSTVNAFKSSDSSWHDVGLCLGVSVLSEQGDQKVSHPSGRRAQVLHMA